ncbi:unnamed protein product [Brassica oleracea]
MVEYSKEVMKVALGYTLITSRTWNAPIHCSRSAITTSRVFSITLGLTKLSDNSFLTVLLQDHVGGLQVLHDQYWVDVPPVLGALVVNSGDFLHLITNGKFISVFWRMQLEHVSQWRASLVCI